MKDPNYLKLVNWSEEDQLFVGSIPDLCEDCCHGDTQLEVYEQLLEIEQSWIEIFRKDGMPLPAIRTRAMREIAV